MYLVTLRRRREDKVSEAACMREDDGPFEPRWTGVELLALEEDTERLLTTWTCGQAFLDLPMSCVGDFSPGLRVELLSEY